MFLSIRSKEQRRGRFFQLLPRPDSHGRNAPGYYSTPLAGAQAKREPIHPTMRCHPSLLFQFQALHTEDSRPPWSLPALSARGPLSYMRSARLPMASTMKCTG